MKNHHCQLWRIKIVKQIRKILIVSSSWVLADNSKETLLKSDILLWPLTWKRHRQNKNQSIRIWTSIRRKCCVDASIVSSLESPRRNCEKKFLEKSSWVRFSSPHFHQETKLSRKFILIEFKWFPKVRQNSDRSSIKKSLLNPFSSLIFVLFWDKF